MKTTTTRPATRNDNLARIRAAVTIAEWNAMVDMYDHVTSEDCEDTLLSRVVQGLFGQALTGDFAAAQKAVSFLDGTIVLNDDGSYERVQRP